MRDIHRIKRNAFNPANKRSNASFYLQCTKAVVAFVFLAGTISFFGTEDFNNITPMHASADEEVRTDRSNTHANNSELFLDAKLQGSYDIHKEGNETPMGGSVDTLFSTTQGSAVFASKFAEIPENLPRERVQITEYVVKPGDTVTNIARRFGLSNETLLWSNHFYNSDYIVPGQTLVILPTDGLMYEVKQGDTLYDIASTHKGNVKEIMEANDIENETHILAGQTLIIPDGVRPAPAPASRRQVAARTPVAQQASSVASGYFARPVNGGRITQWLHPTNAVDIGINCWNPVYAAGPGIVERAVFNNSWSGGFGNNIVIRHDNGTRTLYAHLAPGSARVSYGQRIARGQQIAAVGGGRGMAGAGRSSGCHLHYEVHGARNNVL